MRASSHGPSSTATIVVLYDKGMRNESLRTHMCKSHHILLSPHYHLVGYWAPFLYGEKAQNLRSPCLI